MNRCLQTQVLDFKDRNVLASSKNFQLCSPKKTSSVLAQFGKINSDQYILDMRFPLSYAQAFAIGLSTMYWK